MRYIVMDFTGVKTKDEVQDIIVKNLETPDYYGRNLDSLYDVLTSLKEDVAIDIDGIDEAEGDIAKYLNNLHKVISDAVTATADNAQGKVLYIDIMTDEDDE